MVARNLYYICGEKFSLLNEVRREYEKWVQSIKGKYYRNKCKKEVEMNINYAEVFYQVVKYGGINKASKELFIAKSAISLKVKKLEESLGVELFIRDKIGLKLTPVGEELYQLMQRIEEKSLGLKKKNSKKSICIGLDFNFASFVTGEILERLEGSFWKVEFYYEASDKLKELFELGELDAIISIEKASYLSFDRKIFKSYEVDVASQIEFSNKKKFDIVYVTSLVEKRFVSAMAEFEKSKNFENGYLVQANFSNAPEAIKKENTLYVVYRDLVANEYLKKKMRCIMHIGSIPVFIYYNSNVNPLFLDKMIGTEMSDE